MVRLPSRHTHPVGYNMWWGRTPDNHLLGCKAACEIARYLIQVLETWRRRREACERWKRRSGKIVSQRSTNCTAHAHTVTPHSLSPVLGATNPLGSSYRDKLYNHHISRLHFRQTQIQLWSFPTCNRYKASAMASFMTSNVKSFRSDVRLIPRH